MEAYKSVTMRHQFEEKNIAKMRFVHLNQLGNSQYQNENNETSASL